MAQDLTPAESIRAHVAEVAGGIHVCCPGKVLSFDATTSRCSVLPISHVRVDDDEIALPVLDDLPVCWPRSTGCLVSFPLAVGDSVLVAFANRSLDAWRGAGSQAAPTSPRAHSLSDAFVLPLGVWPDASADTRVSATNLVVAGPGGSSITIAPSGEVTVTAGGAASVHVGGTGAALALAAAVDAQMAALRSALAAFAVPPLGTGVPSTDPGALALQAAVTALLSTGWPTTTAATKAKGV